METFTIRNLSFTYPERREKALDALTLSVKDGAFMVLCGPSGCGKSTLLRQLKPVLTPHGSRSGEILFEGQPLDTLDQRQQSQYIGFVQQSPENQIVTDKVWHELAFGLESLGLDTPSIRRRVAEMAAFFGMESWFHRTTAELSGGQKQLLNLAAVMVMQPTVLILDEPTSQLDPIAAGDFLAMLGKINRELGTTILLTEHRLEEAFPLATEVAVLEQGRLLCSGTPAEVGALLKAAGHSMFLAMPTPMRVWAAVDGGQDCPVTVRDGRDWLQAYAARNPLAPLPPAPVRHDSEKPAIIARELWFRYEKDGLDVVKGLSLTVKKGEFLALLGGNGAGKTTSLKLLAGLYKPVRGAVKLCGRVGLLPQNPQTLFVKKTVREDLLALLKAQSVPQETQRASLTRIVRLCRLENLLDCHPYDLSGGEQQRAALAKVLLSEPELLLLDEPTKGLDAEFKQVFAQILRELSDRGVAILMVSHDIEFCAQYAHRCALFFDGSIVAEGTPRAFFTGNRFYTTAANRMAGALLPDAVTTEDLIAACGGQEMMQSSLPETEEELPPPAEETPDWKPAPLSWWRRLLAAVSGGIALGIAFFFVRVTDLTALISAEGISTLSKQQIWLYALFFGCLALFAASTARRSHCSGTLLPVERRKLSKRTLVAAGLILLLIPLTLLVGETCLDGKKYSFISLLILLETMSPFFLVFEDRKPQARELVVIAVLCALGVAGRAAFFMLPNFKPVTALSILAGVAFGGETGFFVGAMTMLASNVLFGQGPWTPWQMSAMGLVGFLAGVLFRKGVLRRSRLSLCIYGVLAAMFIYGGIMNPASALMWHGELTWEMILSYYISGFPIDCIHAVSTGLFLWFAAEPMLEKLDRIKTKYGLMESNSETL